MMTSRERLGRCYRHQETDRPGLYLRGVTARTPPGASYAPVRDLVVARGDLKSGWHHNLPPNPDESHSRTEPYSEDFDRIVTEFAFPAGTLRTTHLAGRKGQPGMCEEYLLKTHQDAEVYLSRPQLELAGSVEAFFELDHQMGDRGIVEVNLGMNPAGTVADLFGSARFAEMTIEDRELLHALMARRRDEMIALTEWLPARGVGPYFAFLGQEYVAPPLHGLDDFAEFNVQYDRPIADIIHDAGCLLHVHCHGSLAAVLPQFIGVADVLHPIEPPPLGDVTARDAKAVLRGKVCIEGNLQIGDMYTLDPEAMRAMVGSLLSDAFEDRRGLIVCPSASPYIPGMSERYLQNVQVLLDCVAPV